MVGMDIGQRGNDFVEKPLWMLTIEKQIGNERKSFSVYLNPSLSKCSRNPMKVGVDQLVAIDKDPLVVVHGAFAQAKSIDNGSFRHAVAAFGIRPVM